jgi:hypothetical protein
MEVLLHKRKNKSTHKPLMPSLPRVSLVVKPTPSLVSTLLLCPPQESYPEVDALEKGNAFVAHKKNGTVHRIHPGCPSLLLAIQDNLYYFIFETKHCMIQISTNMIHQAACHLLPSSWNKTMEAKRKVITQFTKKLRLTHRAAIHIAQGYFMETEEESKHFIASMKEKAVGKILLII